ncbi:MAG: 30S ribosomal protein S17 [Candidatus Woesearchaeota archaeon]
MVKKSEKEEKTVCNDQYCPFHGKSRLHGRVLSGMIVAAKSHKTVTFVRARQHYLPKFERYESRKTKLLVHNPSCINAKVGDKVMIKETRPLSKTKHFIVVEVLGK